MIVTISVGAAGHATVQDLGRTGAPQIGQMTAGALDQYSATVANTLVASPPSAPLIEVFVQDFSATTTHDLVAAVTGADATVEIDGRPQPQWEPLVWRAGETLIIRRIRSGLRVYLAVHGRLRAPNLLGSCAPDTVLGFGSTLIRGAQLSVATDCPSVSQPWFGIPFFRLGARPHRFGGQWDIDVTEGPDLAEFGDGYERLTGGPFTVTAHSNHIGLRMTPDAAEHLPHRMIDTQVLSRGVPIGAVEVPAGDEIVVLHRGRGVTAGYPVLAVVTQVGLSRLGQAQPGDQVRFHPVSVSAAVSAHREQQAHIADLHRRVDTVFHSLHIPTHFDSNPHAEEPS